MEYRLVVDWVNKGEWGLLADVVLTMYSVFIGYIILMFLANILPIVVNNKKYQKLLKDGGVLPEGVFAYGYDSGETSTTEFYTIYETDLNELEISEYLTYKKLSMLRTIKNCMMVLTVSSIIYMVISILM